MLRLNDSLFRVAIESAPTGIAVCNPNGTIVFINRHVESLFGYSVRELVGRPLHELMPSSEGVEMHPGPGTKARVRILEGTRKDGCRVPVEVSITCVDRDGGELIVASIVDVSDRVELETQIVPTSREYASFEALVADLAARFVMVHPDQVDDAIVDSLRQISERLDLDRSNWWRVLPNSDDAVITHTWTRPDDSLHADASAFANVAGLWSQAKQGATAWFSRPEELPDLIDRESMHRVGIRSAAALPFFANGQLRGILGCSALRRHREWSPEIIDRLRLVAVVFGQALLRKDSDDHLHGALAELRRLRDNLAMENVQLRRDVRVPRSMIVAESPATRHALGQIESVAPTGATVLLLGETGTGKEVFARAIHQASNRHKRPMVTVNCAALPSTLIESELFGRERGAYTGALARQIGRFEMAHESTIFLDEIGELPVDAQVKLLRVLQERVIERLGGGQPVKVDVRIIAATNLNLEKAVEEHAFREDLFYRLNVFPISIPPLRERIEDIPALVWTFIEEYATAFHRRIDSISKDSLAAMKRYGWPGNVRELRNVIERAIIVAKSPQLVVDVPAGTGAVPLKSMRLDDVQTQQIRRVLDSVGWRVRGPGGAAELLGINPNTLDSRMAKLGIRRQPRDTMKRA